MNTRCLSQALILSFIFISTFDTSLNAQRYWTFELHGGWAGNLPLPLRIKQQGHPDIYIKRAKFYSEPFISPYYRDWRFCKHIDKHSIEFEAIHHKLYLKN